jgi:hypothetical protein
MRRAIMMLGQTNQVFALADLDYRHERIASQFHRAVRPFRFRWPVPLVNPNRRRPRPTPTPRPAPHHAMSNS